MLAHSIGTLLKKTHTEPAIEEWLLMKLQN
jgi:hypothetical protein